jgi:hypothetical protein
MSDKARIRAEFIEKFSAILISTATIGRASVSSRRPPARELSRLKEVEPERYGLIKSFMVEFETRRNLPSLKDVNRFVAKTICLK